MIQLNGKEHEIGFWKYKDLLLDSQSIEMFYRSFFFLFPLRIRKSSNVLGLAGGVIDPGRESRRLCSPFGVCRLVAFSSDF